jgi:hypothetical protein
MKSSSPSFPRRRKSSLRSKLVRFMASASVALLAGCASTGSEVRVDKADTFDASRCTSFAWHSPTNEPASFTEQRVRTHVMATLKAKGYSEAAENPSCRVSYVLATRETPKSRPGVGVGVGGGTGGIGGGIGVTLPVGRKSESGTFTVDVIDSAENAQVWSGSVDGTFKSAELSDEEAQGMVEEVLAQFPNRNPQ